jgi:hypothetical protein
VRLVRLLASIALVSGCLAGAAIRTNSSYKSVSQKPVAVFAEKLVETLLENAAVLKIVVENLLDDFLVLWRRGSSEEIEVDFKVLVNPLVDLVELVADFLRSAVLLHGFGFSGSSVLVGSADVNGVVVSQLAVPAVNVSRQDGSDQVS